MNKFSGSVATVALVAILVATSTTRADLSSDLDEARQRVMSDEFDANDKNLKRAFDEINKQLTHDTNLHEMEPNMERIARMIEENKSHQDNNAGVKRDALQLLLSLQSVWTDQVKCNLESYTILKKNNEASGGKAHLPANKFTSKPRLVQALIQKVGLKHAQECQKIYLELYREFKKQFANSQINQDLGVFFDILIDAHIKQSRSSWSLFGGYVAKLEPSDASQPEKIIQSLKSFGSETAASIAYDYLRDYIRDDPDQWYLTRVPVSESDDRLVLKKDKINGFFERYLVEPCEKYLQQGQQLFVPANYDGEMLVEEADDNQDFQKARIRYHLCHKLVHTDRQALFGGILNQAWRASHKITFDE